MRSLALLLSLALCLLGAGRADAHEVRPAYLEIREIVSGEYDILWKTPAIGMMRLDLDVIFPETCTTVTEPNTLLVGGSVLARWRETCPGGLTGARIGVANLDATLTDALVRFEPLTGKPKTLRLTPDSPGGVIPARQPWTEVALSYFTLGVEHILSGVDHLLFVLTLLMLVGDIRRLAGAITTFTIAHSLTLAGTTFGWVRLPSSPVEATIALSIAFVAAEVLRAREGRPGLTQKWPWLVSFSFGLLHGFGFAGALREIGLPEEDTPLALLFFNVGVEAGQLLFIAGVLLLIALWRRFGRELPRWVEAVPVYGIGALACFWFIDRTAGIFGI
jgi:hydrogenase/urease accessory protein HupE